MRNTPRTLTLPELERVCRLSHALWAAENAGLWVRFTYTKDDGSVSQRVGVPGGCFGHDSTLSVIVRDNPDAEFGKSFNLRNITDFEVSLRR